MQGIGIISFDCEGKWGLADQPYGALTRSITDDNLRQYYGEIFRILDAQAVPATFATVQLFLKDRAEVQLAQLQDYAARFPYLAKQPAAWTDEPSGWHAPWLEEAIADRHEIGLHGFTHIPWNELSPEDARQELAQTPEAYRRTIIFPRNRVAHLDVLHEMGCEGYRKAPVKRSKIGKLTAEFNPWSAPAEPVQRDQGITAIPGGYFINWQNGARKLVPASISRMRVRQSIRAAQAQGGVAHFWIHPENIATHPATLNNFRVVVEEMAAARDKGGFEIMTQLEYCRHIQTLDIAA